jgi:hypothetical protein
METFGIWFSYVRRVIVFLLGMLVIIDALYGDHDALAELIIGSIMVGILPLDALYDITRSQRSKLAKSESKD